MADKILKIDSTGKIFENNSSQTNKPFKSKGWTVPCMVPYKMCALVLVENPRLPPPHDIV